MEKINIKTKWIISALFLLAIAVGSSGCTVQDRDAFGQSNADRRIDTFSIVASSFSLIARNGDPTLQIINGTTRYTMTDDTTLSFTPTGEARRQLQLQVDDIIIERPEPGGGVITIIRDF